MNFVFSFFFSERYNVNKHEHTLSIKSIKYKVLMCVVVFFYEIPCFAIFRKKCKKLLVIKMTKFLTVCSKYPISYIV